MSNRISAIAALLAGLLGSPAAHAQAVAVADAVNAGVVKWMSDHGIQHAEVAVSRHGTIIKDYNHGWSPGDPHSIGSLSKAITGLCVSRLLDGGQLRLNDTIGGTLAGYFANKANPAPADKHFKEITVEQLLTHRAGLIKNAFENADITIEDSFRSATKRMLQAKPGTAISYSNSGYLILGYIAQTVGKEDYADLCGADVGSLTGGTTGSIDPSLAYRAPNGGWNESADNYATLIQYLDPQLHKLGKISRPWLDGLPADAGYAMTDNGTDQPPCNLFGGSPAYGFGACLLRTAKGTRYYHDGAVVGKPGGSMFFLNEVGYAAVVIFDAEKSYRDLFKALSGALTSPVAYDVEPPIPVGNDGSSGSNPCQKGGGAYLKQTHTNSQANKIFRPDHTLHPCKQNSL